VNAIVVGVFLARATRANCPLFASCCTRTVCVDSRIFRDLRSLLHRRVRELPYTPAYRCCRCDWGKFLKNTPLRYRNYLSDGLFRQTLVIRAAEETPTGGSLPNTSCQWPRVRLRRLPTDDVLHVSFLLDHASKRRATPPIAGDHGVTPDLDVALVHPESPQREHSRFRPCACDY
jgi:hypothetical protein